MIAQCLSACPPSGLRHRGRRATPTLLLPLGRSIRDGLPPQCTERIRARLSSSPGQSLRPGRGSSRLTSPVLLFSPVFSLRMMSSQDSPSVSLRRLPGPCSEPLSVFAVLYKRCTLRPSPLFVPSLYSPRPSESLYRSISCLFGLLSLQHITPLLGYSLPASAHSSFFTSSCSLLLPLSSPHSPSTPG
ncbi:hypothetical protein OH77DRAFT_1209927 [Trametes cingulata]|nr:hypothetical protein OH77DRAFT_1209927 [Trametes cingulata]